MGQRSCPRAASSQAGPASTQPAAVHVARLSYIGLAGSPKQRESRAEAGGRGGGGRPSAKGRALGGGRGGSEHRGARHPAGRAESLLGPSRRAKAAPPRTPRLSLPLHSGEGVPEAAPILTPPPASPALTSAGGAHYARHFRHFAKTKSPRPEGGERRRQRRSVRCELAGVRILDASP